MLIDVTEVTCASFPACSAIGGRIALRVMMKTTVVGNKARRDLLLTLLENFGITNYYCYTLLKSNVTSRDHVVRCRGSQECWFTLCQFRCQFHSRRHSLRITLKSTTLVCMRSSNA